MANPLGDQPQPNQFADLQPEAVTGPGNWVSHVRVLSILCVIQAGAELVTGAGCVFLGVLTPIALGMQGPGRAAPPPEAMTTMLTVLYAGLGVVLLGIAVLRLVAALRNFQFRGRILGIVSLATGMLTIGFCICFPTALGLLVYGMLVFLDPPVIEAFGARRSGMSVPQVLARYRN